MFSVKDKELLIDGISTAELVKDFKTPLIVYSKNDMKNKIDEIKKDFLSKYPNTRCAYASKAFLCLDMCRFIEKEGLCLDAVSGGELAIAAKAGFPAERIEFNGNNKSYEEIEMAVSMGVGRIIVDGVDELELIEEVCRKHHTKANCLLRISPGVDSHTHEYITTGQLDSKFGIPLSKEIFIPVFKKAAESLFINLFGFHFHVGSQLHDNSSHIKATVVLLDLITELHDKFRFVPSELNIGGGFGIKYTEKDDVKPYSYFLDPVMDLIYKKFAQMGVKNPNVVIEPGRSIVGEAGTTLYTVGTIKDIPNVRKYVSVDGGMTDNIRPALYEALYECDIANKMGENKIEKVTVCGKACESGDILVRDVLLPKASRGDILAVYSTGAYCYAMASNYNKIGMPAVVMIEDGKAEIAVRRESFEDLWARDVM